MATQAHCAYCFESVDAILKERPALSLRQVEALWKKYKADLATTDPPKAAHEDLDPSDSELDENTSPSAESATEPRPAAISRLLSPSTASSSSVQSVSSTPSGLSEASSATSKSSSRSSFFSLSKRLRREEEERVGEHPLFVTWNVKKGEDRRLRGCIGTFEAQELDHGLNSYARTSAFHDTRFSPITEQEFPTLECGVTLLTHFEPIADPMDWEIGTHGLRITFIYNGRRYSSTYLPDVAKEQEWTKEETMISLMRKAGWSGRRHEWRKVELDVVRYQGKQVRLWVEEWMTWRQWVEKRLADE